MKLSFVETMRGEVTDGAGRVHPVDFQIRTTQQRAGHFLVEGVVHAGTFGDEAPCTGTLTITVAPPSIAYDVRWATTAGAFSLKGAKSPSPLSPLRSMTVLPVALLDAAGAALAKGTMTFDLFDLPGFLASWLPVKLGGRRRFDARLAAVTRSHLLEGQS
ncbi:MAG: hypothetical protein JNJ54_14605 [Myxococcaceae bacterium]|nr:hypothetical protein [Myxococcaceae bacterium]